MAQLIPENLRSRDGVPAGIRRAAGAFQDGLGDDAAVWYEPPYDTSGDKPHLVLLWPGNGIIVLEVLDVQGGGLIGTVRKKLRVFRDGREVELHHPIVRAQRFAEELRRRVAVEEEEGRRLAGMTIPVVPAAVFPSLERRAAAEKRLDTIVPSEWCLFKDDIDVSSSGDASRLADALATICRGRIEGEAPEDLYAILHGIVQPDAVIDRVASAERDDQFILFRPPAGGEDAIRVLDLKQEALAKSLGGGHRIIRGVAGSGKTLILVFRARLLARLQPNRRILVTCFTRALAGQLRVMLEGYANVRVRHVDGLMADVIRDVGMKNPLYADRTGEAVAKTALEALAAGEGRRYKTILVDEAQDLSTLALQFVVGLLDGKDSDLIVVADAAQNIFRRKFSWKQAGIEAQGRSVVLKLNYRNTKEILSFAWHFLMAGGDLRPDDAPAAADETSVIRPEAAARTGAKPTVLVVASDDDQVTQTLTIVRDWIGAGERPRQVAIIYPQDIKTADGTMLARRLYEALGDAGVPAYWLSEPGNGSAKDHIAEVTTPVVLTTVYSAQGLEFPDTVLCGVSSPRSDDAENRRLVYSAMTRAMERLSVIARQGDPLLEDLRRAEGSQS